MLLANITSLLIYYNVIAIFQVCSMSSAKNLDITQLLLGHGAKLDVLTKGNRHTPLHKAILNGENDVASVLIKHKSTPINALDSSASTPLHYALRYENVTTDIVLLMISRGATLYGPQDDHSKIPLDYVEMRSRTIFEVAAKQYSSKNSKVSAHKSTPTKGTPTKWKPKGVPSPQSDGKSSVESGKLDMFLATSPLRTAPIAQSPIIMTQQFFGTAGVLSAASPRTPSGGSGVTGIFSGTKRPRSSQSIGSEHCPQSSLSALWASCSTPLSSQKSRYCGTPLTPEGQDLFNAASSQAAISSVTTSCETNSTLSSQEKMAARLDHQTVLFKQFSRHLEAKKAAAIEKELAKRVEKEKNKVVVINQKPTISKKKTRMKTRANSVSDFKVDDSGSSTSSEEEGEGEVLGSRQ